MSFLDATGLGTFWGKLKNYFVHKSDTEAPVTGFTDIITPDNIISDSFFTGTYYSAVMQYSSQLSGTWSSPTHNVTKYLKSSQWVMKVLLDDTGNTADDINISMSPSVSPASGSAITMSFTKTHSYNNYSILLYSNNTYTNEYVTSCAIVTVNNVNIVPDLDFQGSDRELFKDIKLIKSENGNYTYKMVSVTSGNAPMPTVSFDVKDVSVNTSVVLKIDRMGVFRGGFKDPAMSVLDAFSPLTIHGYINSMVHPQSNLNVRPGLAIARSVGGIKGSEYSKIVIPIAVITGLIQNYGGYINFLYAFSIPDYQGAMSSHIVVKSYNIKLGWIMTSTSVNFRKKEIIEDYSDVASGLTCTADIRVNGSYIELVLSGGFFSGITAPVNGYGIILINTRPQIRFLTWSTPYGEN